MNVNSWGKLKTAAQMGALISLLLARCSGAGPSGLAQAPTELAITAGAGMMTVAVGLTLYSMCIYCKQAVEVLF